MNKFKPGQFISPRAVGGFSPEYWRVVCVGRVTVTARNINNHQVRLFHVEDVRIVPEKMKSADIGMNNLTEAARKSATAIFWKSESSSVARSEKRRVRNAFAYAGRIFGKIRAWIGFLWRRKRERTPGPSLYQSNPENRPIFEGSMPRDNIALDQEGRVKEWRSR